MAETRARSSLTGTRIPLCAVISSGFPPTRLATTGNPAAMDSRIAFDKLSEVEGSTDKSSDAKIAGMSRRSPRNLTTSPRPRFSASRSSSERRGPSPTKTHSKAENVPRSFAAARMRSR